MENDNKYLVTRFVTGVAVDGSAELVLQNDGENALYIEEVVFKNNQGKALVEATQDISIDSPGTAVDVESVRVNGVQGEEDFSAEFGGTYSGGDTFDIDLVTGATSPGSGVARIATSTSQTAFLLDRDRSIRFTVTNLAGNASDVLMKVVAFQPERS